MKISKIIASCLLATSLTWAGCTNDDFKQQSNNDPDAPISFKVSISCANTEIPASRGLAHGGSNWNEANIYDVLVIIYDTPLNSTGGKIVDKIYLSSLTKADASQVPTNTYTAKAYTNGVNYNPMSNEFKAENLYTADVTQTLDEGDYYAVAVANLENMQSIAAEFTTDAAGLNNLRNYIYKGSLYQYPSGRENYPADYTHFAMSSIGEERFTFNRSAVQNGTFELPTLYVQRLAARVEFTFGVNDSEVKYLWEPRISGSNTTWYDVIFLAPPAEGTTYDYPFNNWRESLYFPIYDAISGNRITGAVFVLDDITLLNTITAETGEYLFERNEVNGGSIFGTEDFDNIYNWGSFDKNAGYAHFNILTPAVKDYADVTRRANDEFAHESCGRCTYNTSMHTGVAVFDYIRESTFGTYNADNNYVKVKLQGRTNLIGGHFDGSTTATLDGTNSFAKVTSIFPLRHCKPTDTFDPSQKMAYAVVRNTIYHIMVRFYAQGDDLTVRWYYYNGSTGNYTDNPYNVSAFGEYILEHQTGTTPND